jgi:HSP20 family protein
MSLYDDLMDGFVGIRGWVGSPRADVRKVEGGLEFVYDLPGLGAKDVEVGYEDGVLTVSGKAAVVEGEWLLREREVGTFRRSFRVGDGYDASGVKAVMKDGVLRVTLPAMKVVTKGVKVTVEG